MSDTNERSVASTGSVADAQEATRNAFEEWIVSRGEFPMKGCGKIYLDDSHRDMWEAWEAATRGAWTPLYARQPREGDVVLWSVRGVGVVACTKEELWTHTIYRGDATHWMPIPKLPTDVA